MPTLWAKIEARRSPLFAMQRMARLLVFGAMAAALIMGAVLTPLMESHHPAGHYADVVARNDTKARVTLYAMYLAVVSWFGGTTPLVHRLPPRRHHLRCRRNRALAGKSSTPRPIS